MYKGTTALTISSHRYKGDWSKGVRCGHGVLIKVDGDRYVGSWQNDQRNGYGTKATPAVWLMRYHPGLYDDVVKKRKYLGMWSEGLRSGFGVTVHDDGIYYEGTHAALWTPINCASR